MIPVLYPRDELFYRFLGKGKLTDTISCVVHEELNGDYSLELQYPVTGEHLQDLYNGGTILVFSPQPVGSLVKEAYFDVYKHSDPIDGVVTFYASHVSRRLKDYVYIGSKIKENYSFSNNTVPSLTTIPPAGELRLGVSAVSGPGETAIDAPMSVLASLIGEETSYVALYGKDVYYITTHPTGMGEQSTPGCTVTCNVRGEDNGVQIRLGYDLVDFNYETDDTDTFNALVPYWDDGDGTKTYVTGYIVQPTTPITPIKAVPMDFTSSFNIRPPGAVLAQAAQDWLDANTPWVGAETIDADFLNGVEIYPKGAPVLLGDYVIVNYYAGKVKKKMRVIAYDYDVLAECYTKMQLGTQPTNFVSVTGIDGGGGASVASGGGASVSTIISPTTTTGTSESITASDYDFLVFTSENNSGRVYGTTVIPAALIANNNVSSVYVYAGNTNYYDAFTVSSTSVTLSTVTGGVYGAVYGVKIN